jgi:hypothetical protein
LLDLPPEEIFHLLLQAFHTSQPKRFHFPVAFASNLRQLAILGCVIRATPTEPFESGPAVQYQCQSLGLWSQKLDRRDAFFTPPSEVRSGEFPKSDLLAMRWSDKLLECFLRGGLENHWYQTVFSPCGKYLALLRGEGKPGRGYTYCKWELTIFSDDNFGKQMPDFQFLARIGMASNGAASRAFVFHPHLPILAITGLSITSLWFFAKRPSKYVPICDNVAADTSNYRSRADERVSLSPG